MSEPALEIQELDCYEYRACRYVYEPERGDDRRNVEAGTLFSKLPINWRCPVSGSNKKAFANVGPIGQASRFTENMGHGFGVNKLTPNQKHVLIFGALALGFLFFISLYSLK